MLALANLFSQKAERLQEFPAFRQTLLDCPPGDFFSYSYCLSRKQDLASWMVGEMEKRRFDKGAVEWWR